jgi:hypothetical protein
MDLQEAKAAAAAHWKAQPSPHAPGLTNAEFPSAVKLATKMKFGGHASPPEAAAFWSEFKSFNERLKAKGKDPLSPESFGHVAEDMAKISFAFHGRPPRMDEIEKLHDQTPKSVRDHYYNLPDQHYPTVPAGDMVRSLEAAKPHANEQIQRDPNKLEAAYLYHSGESPQAYYEKLGQEKKSKNVQAPA